MPENVEVDVHATDNLEIVLCSEVDAIILSTSEHEHILPAIQALERGMTILVEKPIALGTHDADKMCATAEHPRAEFRSGYCMRFANSVASRLF